MKFKIQSQGILKKNIFLFVFTASFLLLIAVFIGKNSAFRMNQDIPTHSSEKNTQNSSSERNPANFIGNPYIIPTGTQMMIPPWIMEQYLLSEQAVLYGDALNFLIHNYGVSAPSASDEDEDTYYIPLTRYKKKYDYDFDYDTPEPDDSDDDDDESDLETVMVAVTSLNLDQTPTDTGTTTPQPGATTPQPETTTPQPEAGTQPQPETGTQPQPEAGIQPQPEAGTQPQPRTTTPPATGTQPQPGITTPQPGTTTPPATTTPPPATTTPQPRTTTTPQPETDTGPIFTTTEPTDTSKSPLVPEYRPEEDLSETHTASCEKSDEDASQTEAALPCVDCALNLRQGKTNEFLSEVGAAVNHFNKGKKFSALIKKFCKSCRVDIGDFMKYLERRAREKNVPPEIMLAIMLRESDGDCNAGGDSKKSQGLFQLNTGNSTCLQECNSNSLSNVSAEQMAEQMRSVCEDGKHRDIYKRHDRICVARPDETSKICLNNPYCNFEESLNLLIDEKWGIGNKGKPEKPPLMITDEDNPDKTKLRNWTDMSDTERTKWRNAIIAYNGAGALKAAEKAILANEEQMKNALGMGREPFLNNWEIKRMFFIKHHLNIKAKFKKCDTKQYPDANTAAEVEEEKTKCKKIYNPENGMTNLVHNLAYVERIAGREKKGDFANSSICQWIQFRKNNKNLSCK